MLPRILLISGIALLVAAQPASALESVEVLKADLGHVLLKWENPGVVAVEPVSWSSLKALFLR